MRTGKPIALNAPLFFFARDRAIADEAFAGDIVGIPNHGILAHRRRADRGRGSRTFTGIPSFAPEFLRRIAIGDPMKAKQLREALEAARRRGRGAAVHARWTAPAPSSAWSARYSSTCWRQGFRENMA